MQSGFVDGRTVVPDPDNRDQRVIGGLSRRTNRQAAVLSSRLGRSSPSLNRRQRIIYDVICERGVEPRGRGGHKELREDVLSACQHGAAHRSSSSALRTPPLFTTFLNSSQKTDITESIAVHESTLHGRMGGAADFKMGYKTGFANGASEKKVYLHFSKYGGTRKQISVGAY